MRDGTARKRETKRETARRDMNATARLHAVEEDAGAADHDEECEVRGLAVERLELADRELGDAGRAGHERRLRRDHDRADGARDRERGADDHAAAHSRAKHEATKEDVRDELDRLERREDRLRRERVRDEVDDCARDEDERADAPDLGLRRVDLLRDRAAVAVAAAARRGLELLLRENELVEPERLHVVPSVDHHRAEQPEAHAEQRELRRDSRRGRREEVAHPRSRPASSTPRPRDGPLGDPQLRPSYPPAEKAGREAKGPQSTSRPVRVCSEGSSDACFIIVRTQ